MPIYEYRCKKCGKTFEYMQRMADAPKKKCEACGASALERLISNTSFQLKGSGWYKDLYSSAKPASGSDAGSGSGSESGSGSGSDSSSASGASSDSTPAKAEKKDAKDTKDTKKAKKGASK